MIVAKNLTRNILIGMLLGILVGLICNIVINYADSTIYSAISSIFPSVSNYIDPIASFVDEGLLQGLFFIGGKVFISLLKLLIVPVVFVSLICGTYQLRNNANVGRIATKTIGLYILTTMFAVSIGLLVATSLSIGKSLDAEHVMTEQLEERQVVSFEEVSIVDSLSSIIPENLFSVLGQNNQLLQVILFAVIFGLALSITGKEGERVASLFEDLNVVILRLVFILMQVAPYGVFFLIAQQMATLGFDLVGKLISYFFVVVFVILLHGVSCLWFSTAYFRFKSLDLFSQDESSLYVCFQYFK